MGPTPQVAAAWLLTADKHSNSATAIDAECADRVPAHVDGAAYFARLQELLSGLSAGTGCIWPTGASTPPAS